MVVVVDLRGGGSDYGKLVLSSIYTAKELRTVNGSSAYVYLGECRSMDKLPVRYVQGCLERVQDYLFH